MSIVDFTLSRTLDQLLGALIVLLPWIESCFEAYAARLPSRQCRKKKQQRVVRRRMVALQRAQLAKPARRMGEVPADMPLGIGGYMASLGSTGGIISRCVSADPLQSYDSADTAEEEREEQ
ncbi:hypothetical protein ACJQWK_05398 [Exserohilum turcicum]